MKVIKYKKKFNKLPREFRESFQEINESYLVKLFLFLHRFFRLKILDTTHYYSEQIFKTSFDCSEIKDCQQLLSSNFEYCFSYDMKKGDPGITHSFFSNSKVIVQHSSHEIDDFKVLAYVVVKLADNGYKVFSNGPSMLMLSDKISVDYTSDYSIDDLLRLCSEFLQITPYEPIMREMVEQELINLNKEQFSVGIKHGICEIIEEFDVEEIPTSQSSF